MLSFWYFLHSLDSLELWKTPDCVDSSTNFEQSLLQNMRIQIKSPKNKWTQIISRNKYLNLIKFYVFTLAQSGFYISTVTICLPS